MQYRFDGVDGRSYNGCCAVGSVLLYRQFLAASEVVGLNDLCPLGFLDVIAVEFGDTVDQSTTLFTKFLRRAAFGSTLETDRTLLYCPIHRRSHTALRYH